MLEYNVLLIYVCVITDMSGPSISLTLETRRLLLFLSMLCRRQTGKVGVVPSVRFCTYRENNIKI